MNIKNLIKNKRLEHGMTMKELADKVGVSEATISRWESGEISNMKHKGIIKLAETLQIAPNVIMGWEDTENETDETETNVPTLIAAHWEGNGDFTEEQLEEISNFIDFVKSKNKGNK